MQYINITWVLVCNTCGLVVSDIPEFDSTEDECPCCINKYFVPEVAYAEQAA